MKEKNIPSFLTRMLYRVDFRTLVEDEFEDVFSKISKNYKDKFTAVERRIEYNNELIIQDMGKKVHPVKKELDVYVFTGYINDFAEATLKLSKSFLYLDVKPNKPDNSQEFFKMFSDLLDMMKSTINGIFNFRRIGIRKYNLMFYNRNADMKRLLNQHFYSFNRYDETSLENYQSMETVSKDNFKVNIVKKLDHGILNDSTEVNRLFFDYDVYCEQLNNQCSEDTYVNLLLEMNEVLLIFYKNTFRKDAFEKLVNGKEVIVNYGVYI